MNFLLSFIFIVIVFIEMVMFGIGFVIDFVYVLRGVDLFFLFCFFRIGEIFFLFFWGFEFVIFIILL